MKTRTFTSSNGLKLTIISRKSAVIFEMAASQMDKKYQTIFNYDSNGFVELFNYIESISNESWDNLTPKEANSLSADYYEYYDKEFDNNGYLSIRDKTLVIDRPVLESNKLYQFNKKKMESFINDFKKLLV